MKRIIVCCDGTWNLHPPLAEELTAPTNVAKIAQLVAPFDEEGLSQISFYQDGTAAPPGGTGGVSLAYRLTYCIEQGYRFIASNFTPGDEIWLFGFSRGAYTARSIVGMIRNAGILKPQELDKFPLAYDLYRNRFPETHPDSGYAAGFRDTFSVSAPIKFLGVWDTIGRLGVPDSMLAECPSNSWSFHNVALSSIVENAYQAVALDERRMDYRPCLWQSKPATKGEQVLFPGGHCDVGGGYYEAGLSDCALAWMVCKARSCGLAFAPSGFAVIPDPLGVLHDLGSRGRAEEGGERLVPEGVLSFCADARKEGAGYRPGNCPEPAPLQGCKNRSACANLFRCH